MIGFRCPFRGMFELQMQVFVRTGVGTTCFRAICGACETTDSPGHTLNLWGRGAEAASLASISSDSERTHQPGTPLGF